MNPYESPNAFRQALEERLRNHAQGNFQRIQRLRRRVSFERFLARLQEGDATPWILKGGMAMEIRLGFKARNTRDVDLGFISAQLAQSNPAIDDVEKNIRKSVSRDLADHFSFEVQRPAKLPIAKTEVLRFSLRVKLARRIFENLRVDISVGEVALAPPEILTGSELLSFAGIPPVRLHLVSKAQHFAEKILAFTKSWEDRENTRAKDLVDLILLLSIDLPPREELCSVLSQAFLKERSSEPPAVLPNPPSGWELTYPPLADEVGHKEKTVAQAFAKLSVFWSKLMSSS